MPNFFFLIYSLNSGRNSIPVSMSTGQPVDGNDTCAYASGSVMITLQNRTNQLPDFEVFFILLLNRYSNCKHGFIYQ